MRSPGELRARWPSLSRILERVNLQATLLVGFALIFALWTISTLELVWGFAQAQSRAHEIHSRHMETEQLLSEVRGEVLLAAVHLRDALMDTSSDDQSLYLRRLLEGRRRIEGHSARLGSLLDGPGERRHWQRLKAEVDDYWSTVLPVLDWAPERRAEEGTRYLRQELIPKRRLIMAILEGVLALNEVAYQRQQFDLARLSRDTKRRFAWLTGMTLLLGIVVGVLSIRHAGTLEDRLRRQHLQDVENRRDLQRLSARLVHAQEEERRVIARELHDEIGQALTAVKIDLAVAERSLHPADKARRLLGEARAIADRTLQAVRDLSHLLHPAMLDDLGLPDTLNWYLRRFSRRTGIRTEFVPQGMEGRLAPKVEICAYRIVQEALTNIARHAEASLCRVHLQRVSPVLRITIEDDGKGFDAAPEAAGGRGGLGLLGIQERVAELEGAFRLESTAGRGTRMFVELPALPAESRSAEAEAAETQVPFHPLAGEKLDGQVAHPAGR